MNSVETTRNYANRVPDGWQINVGNLGTRVHVEKSEPAEPEPTAAVKPDPMPARVKLPQITAGANAVLGLTVLVMMVFGPEGGWRAAIGVLAGLSLLGNAVYFFARNRGRTAV